MKFLLGQKLLAQKEYSEALKIFLNLKESNHINDEVLFYLGLIYFELNNFDKSAYYYNKFLEKKPNSIKVLYNIAFLKQSMGEIDAAKVIYNKLIEKDKNKVRPYYGLFTLNSNNLNDKEFDHILKLKNDFEHSIFENGIINYLLSKKEKKINIFLKNLNI